MAELEVVCPSGLAGTVRGWKAREANLLASSKNARTGSGFDKMLSACWLTTSNPGPYKDASNGNMDWVKVLTCDRFWTLLRVRAATFGDDYSFTVNCEDRRNCGRKIDWECNLSELPCDPLPKESRDKIAADDNRFPYVLQSGDHEGTKLYYRLQNGAGEREAVKLLQGQDTRLIVASLAARIVEVEGVDKGMMVKFLDNMEMSDLAAILDAFDETDGGVETTIEIECDNCGLQQDVELPLGRTFWLPRTKKKRAAGMLDLL